MKIIPISFFCLVLSLLPQLLFAQKLQKLRVVVLTDIEADPDDAQSMIRFLTYANMWDIEGLIATTSIHQKNRVAPESLHKILLAYGKVQPNLLKHEKSYPAFEQLKGKIKKGIPVYGMEGVGEGKDSQAWIGLYTFWIRPIIVPSGLLYGVEPMRLHRHYGKSNIPKALLLQKSCTAR
jgi:hypothetical protein